MERTQPALATLEPADGISVIAASFFSVVSQDGCPADEGKCQPWKSFWSRPQSVSEKGKMIVACTYSHDYGMCLSLSIFKDIF
jgi:hypothetical protein